MTVAIAIFVVNAPAFDGIGGCGDVVMSLLVVKFVDDCCYQRCQWCCCWIQNGYHCCHRWRWGVVRFCYWSRQRWCCCPLLLSTSPNGHNCCECCTGMLLILSVGGYRNGDNDVFSCCWSQDNGDDDVVTRCGDDIGTRECSSHCHWCRRDLSFVTLMVNCHINGEGVVLMMMMMMMTCW